LPFDAWLSNVRYRFLSPVSCHSAVGQVWPVYVAPMYGHSRLVRPQQKAAIPNSTSPSLPQAPAPNICQVVLDHSSHGRFTSGFTAAGSSSAQRKRHQDQQGEDRKRTFGVAFDHT
jgi:hypothetical protein